RPRSDTPHPDRGVSMPDGRDPSTGFSFRYTFPLMEIFRFFQVALDPRKLLFAAVGILVMAFGWYMLSAMFYYKAPDSGDDRYRVDTLKREYQDRKKPNGENYTDQ